MISRKLPNCTNVTHVRRNSARCLNKHTKHYEWALIVQNILKIEIFFSSFFPQKYELKRHRTVHENITYTCPYCQKVVKRKPSMIKHLRLTHKGEEQIWSEGNFIAKLKKFTNPSNDGFIQSESSNTNESSTDERNNFQSKNTSSSGISSSYGNFFFISFILNILSYFG